MSYLAPEEHPVIEGVRGALGVALPCAIVPLLVHVLGGADKLEPWSAWQLASATLAGGAVGGLVFGLLHSWRATLAGRFARGFLIGCAVLVSITPFTGETPEWGDWKLFAMIAVIGGLIDVVRGGPGRN